MYFVSFLYIFNVFALCIIFALLLFYLLYPYNVTAYIKTHTNNILLLYGIFYAQVCIPFIFYILLCQYLIYIRYSYVHLSQLRCIKMFIHVSCPPIYYIDNQFELSLFNITVIL